MNAEILTIGDELLIGQIVNTNQTYIAEKLSGIGIRVRRMTTVGDNLDMILEALDKAWKRSDLLLVTGGLGPTHDDVTKHAVCKFFTTDLVSNDEVRKNIEHLLRLRNAAWSPAAEEQTMFPRNAQIIPNRRGTAAGMLFDQNDRCCIVLPGVPYEMTAMIDDSVLPFLKSRLAGPVVRHLTLRTTGISESVLARELGDLDTLLQGATLAFLPSPFGVRLRITVEDANETFAGKKIQELEQRIREKSGKYIYGMNDEELEEVVGMIVSDRKLTIAVAESCTGGLITDLITNVSGSSTYFERGVVVYSDKSKTDLLGVSPELIIAHGAVSKQVAEAMAIGVRNLARTDIGLSTTGIAGPTGGSPEKPVGLVWIAYADSAGTVALRFNFGDDRRRVKERAAAAALELVRRKVLGLN
jgi:nicotinamide-nucleotide amidase